MATLKTHLSNFILILFYVFTFVLQAESRVGDLVESILDLGSEEIISWRAMTEVLLNSDLQEQYEMSREEVTALVQITGHLVRTACTGYPKIDDERKKKMVGRVAVLLVLRF